MISFAFSLKNLPGLLVCFYVLLEHIPTHSLSAFMLVLMISNWGSVLYRTTEIILKNIFVQSK